MLPLLIYDMYSVYEFLDTVFVSSEKYFNWSPDVDRRLNKSLKSQTYTSNPKPKTPTLNPETPSPKPPNPKP